MKFSPYLAVCLIFFSTISIFAQSETEKGVELYRNGDFDGAITVLQNVVKTDTKDRQAWLYLGLSFGKQGNDNEALKSLHKWDTISEKPKNEKTNGNDGFKILSKPRSIYTELARQNQTQGRVKLIVEFMESGKIGLVFALQTLPDGLTENCIYAAQQIKFQPAQKDGKPIPVVKTITYDFSVF